MYDAILAYLRKMASASDAQVRRSRSTSGQLKRKNCAQTRREGRRCTSRIAPLPFPKTALGCGDAAPVAAPPLSQSDALSPHRTARPALHWRQAEPHRRLGGRNVGGGGDQLAAAKARRRHERRALAGLWKFLRAGLVQRRSPQRVGRGRQPLRPSLRASTDDKEQQAVVRR